MGEFSELGVGLGLRMRDVLICCRSVSRRLEYSQDFIGIRISSSLRSQIRSKNLRVILPQCNRNCKRNQCRYSLRNEWDRRWSWSEGLLPCWKVTHTNWRGLVVRKRQVQNKTDSSVYSSTQSMNRVTVLCLQELWSREKLATGTSHRNMFAISNMPDIFVAYFPFRWRPGPGWMTGVVKT